MANGSQTQPKVLYNPGDISARKNGETGTTKETLYIS